MTGMAQAEAHRAAGGGTTRRRALVLASAAAFWGRASRAQAPDLTIALSSNSFSTVVVRMASRMGTFGKHGLNVRVITMENANAATAALVNGAVQMAIAGAGEVFAARAHGQDLVMVCNLYRGLSSAVVMSKAAAAASGVRPDAPVEDRLKALIGLTLASPSPTAVLGISVQMAVKRLGGSPKMTYIGLNAMPAALESGAIAAMVGSTPYWVTPVVRGVGIPWINCALGELPFDVAPTSSAPLAVRGDFARAQPGVISAVRAAVKEVGTFVATQPEQAKALIGELYPDIDRAALEDAFSKEWQNWTKPVFTEDDVRHDLAMMRSSGLSLPGLDAINPQAVLAP